MNVTVTDEGVCRKVLQIEVAAETVAGERQEVVRSLAKMARVPGFRPGRVPLPEIERRFAKEIASEVRERLVSRSYRDAVAQKKLRPVAVVQVEPDEAVNRDQPFRVKITIDAEPPFALPEYRGIPVTRRAVAVTEAQVDEGVRGLQARAGKMVDVTDRGVQPGDFAQIDYSGACEGAPVAQIAGPEGAPLGEGKEFWCLIGDPEFLPGLNAGLAGATVGERRMLQIAFPADYRVAPLAGKKALYTVEVKRLRLHVPAELTPDLLREVGVASEGELRDKLRASMHRAGESAEERRIQGEILQWLLQHTELRELPESSVERETKQVLSQIVRENLQRGIPREEIEGHKDDIYNSAVKSSTERVRLDFILARIADEVKTEVSDQDLAGRVNDMAEQYRLPAQKLRAELEKRGMLDALREEIRMGKTVEWLRAQAKVTEGEAETPQRRTA